MVVFTIIFGLLGLGIIIFVHESGHFIAAKANGIHVETFSLGWGKKLVGVSRKGTDYRISWFPIGGYCKMKGEMLRANLDDEEMERMRHEKGSFLAASPWQRILVAAAGPLANMVFAILALSMIWWIGFSTFSWPNKIVTASDYLPAGAAGEYPAELAGLKTGDRIIAMNGVKTESFWDITETILKNAGKLIQMRVERETAVGMEILTLTVQPEIDPETGQPIIGIHSWIDPVIGKIEEGTAASLAGLRPDDRIISAGSREINHSVDFRKAFEANPGKMELAYLREGRQHTATLITDQDDVGFSWRYSTFRSPRLGFFGSLSRGFLQAFELLNLTVKGIGQLLKFRFKGIEIAGPIRMTKIMGEAATEGFGMGFGAGLISFFRILGFISVAIAFAQLLPIPVLDGGQIILSALEALRRRPLAPKFIYWFQIVGFFIILLILVSTIMNDILSFVK
jgi:regulator of sigma E protease